MINIGKRLRDLRLEKNLTQEELGERTDLTKGFVSQLENNNATPSLETLFAILGVLGCSASEFFDDSAMSQKVIYRKNDVTDFEDTMQKYRLSWLAPDSNEFEMEPVKLVFDEGGMFKQFEPSLAETFGYVLRGKVKILIGKETYVAHEGESFYFYCQETHQIVNDNKGTTEVLLVVSDSYL